MSAEMPKMPEPFARISSVMGKVMLFHAPGFTMRKGDAVFTADQMREYAEEATRQAMERCAEVCESRITGGIPLTRASNDFDCEAMACADAIRALLPQDPDHLAGVGNMVDGKDQSEKRHG